MDAKREKVSRVIELLSNFQIYLDNGDIRDQVLRLVPIDKQFKDIGKMLIPNGLKVSAPERILQYFLKYPMTVISHKEVAVIAGISEWARRVRELRVESGWAILNGKTVQEMIKSGELELEEVDFSSMKVHDYILINERQDRDAAYRWQLAKKIRSRKVSIKEKILEFLKDNVGREITGEELRYVSGDKTEWARRVRELRTEEGWPIVTKMNGRPDLPTGIYVLEMLHQAPKPDRKIPDSIRRAVLQRDSCTCQKCGWNSSKWDKVDPITLELHHIIQHADGGESTVENLITYCNVCHDELHKYKRG
ncbi:HNH endonuclease signature motif containing protein [Marispirochaeta sp.]|uniref:HNH endonuclease n=1 Tax=Marispirochaeta sp. TaxID=2038653 RepID=UPI0029C69472|nr:HNH endonuclease signature motif containing protein [Marispirochaeta sp.]